jgi:dihydrofolate reductase
MLSAIVAMAHKNVIGKKNDLPWYLPADLKRTREVTTGHAIIMGRGTADSIIAKVGHGLPNRKNIVITHQTDYHPEGMFVVHDLDEALALAAGDPEPFIFGGEQIYRLAMPRIERLYITEVDADIDGDTFFPEINPNEWHEVAREAHEKDEKNEYDYSYVTFDRISG